MLRLYKRSLVPASVRQKLEIRAKKIAHMHVCMIQSEYCFYVHGSKQLQDSEMKKLLWILDCDHQTCWHSHFAKIDDTDGTDVAVAQYDQSNNSILSLIIEVGPRINVETAWSANAVSICHSAAIDTIDRIERSRRYLINYKADDSNLSEDDISKLAGMLFDRMTECRYINQLDSFEIQQKIEDFYEIDAVGQGTVALEKANVDLGLAFDKWDIEFYTKLFVEDIGRNPTNVELFDLSQSNSEHSRHWFFNGKLNIDGQLMPKSLLKMVQETQVTSSQNSVIKFHDNSSAIRGYEVEILLPNQPMIASHYKMAASYRHITFTAETHNFPTAVAPFQGATTGTGGRIRDVQATGRGANVIAATVGYCFGNLNIPGYSLPWEDDTFKYPNNFATPLEIAIQASDGASDYGNKFGEPVISGFARSYGLELYDGQRREYIKPIMFSGGIGSIDDRHVKKSSPKPGMYVVKIGGPAYRIGMGGGSASSQTVQGDNCQLDFNAVQRGDAEMGQKLNRVVKGCIELQDANPIKSIHDQGAGGNGNVLKELVYPEGALINLQSFILGDKTLSAVEIWCAEYQENNALLTDQLHKIQDICKREKLPIAVIGKVIGNGIITLADDAKTSDSEQSSEGKYPVDLKLCYTLGSIPQKTFHLQHIPARLISLSLPENLRIFDALNRVLRLPSVASKRYLTNKVDRSVTGLVAQQQCVGSLHTPLADVGVIALSFFNIVGSATAIGEQPVKMLLDPAAGARMAVCEALTNLVFAEITSLEDVKCSANWMWPAKLPGEGAKLYQACKAMCEVMKLLEIAVDGGKDSLSMAAQLDEENIIKGPGTLVISTYCSCPDITTTITPDLKCDDAPKLVYIHLSQRNFRLGGSALAQVFKQLGHEVPDLHDVNQFKSTFSVIQLLIRNKHITAGHDISDGGLITSLLEMAFAGNCGFNVDIGPIAAGKSALEVLFAEELGFILEVNERSVGFVMSTLRSYSIDCYMIGFSIIEKMITISNAGNAIIEQPMPELRNIWEATSFELEKLQANTSCIESEERNLKRGHNPAYHLSFSPKLITIELISRPRVAVIREEGSNGDREMAAALYLAGFEVWDLITCDLNDCSTSLDSFRGIVFVGGFSYADVLGSGRGWAASITCNDTIWQKIKHFRRRFDTFSLGVCNGCQLMAYLGWIGSTDIDLAIPSKVLFTVNISNRFESRFPTVKIFPSPSIMLTDMEGSQLGIWIAHAEGYAKFSSDHQLNKLIASNLVPIRYVDHLSRPTELYPLNPSGSPGGVAAICSNDGRHLAMMPHPERCFQLWQWPWMPNSWKQSIKVSPWLKMFQNAYNWCCKTSD